MSSRLFPDGQSNLFSPLIDVVANGMAAMFVILMVYMALFNRKEPTPPIVFLDVDAPPVICGVPYVFTPPVAGGTSEREFFLATGEDDLPLGLQLDKKTGTIYGTPTCAGEPAHIETASFGLTVRSNNTAQRKVGLTIYPGAIPYDPNHKLDIQTTDQVLPTARVGVAYALPFGAEGGAQPFYRWTVTKGRLPNGITLSTSDGILRGTPTEPGLFDFEVKLEHGPGQFTHREARLAWTGAQQARAYRLEVLSEEKPTVELPVAQQGDPYLGAVLLARRARGETLEVEVSDKGLKVGADGLLTGKPLQPGTASVAYKIIRNGKPVHEGKADLTVLPERYKAELRGATYHVFEDQVFRIPITVSGLREPLEFTVADLPPWAKLENRAITGKPPTPGTYEFKPSARDLLGGQAAGTVRLEVTAFRRPLTIETPPVIELPTGSARHALSASGGDGNYRWTVAGEMPRGLTLSSAGVLESNVPEPGEAMLPATVEDHSGGKQTQTLTLRFKHGQTKSLELLSTELATGVISVPYRFDLAVGGSVGRVKMVIHGLLPEGMAVKDGTIFGTPRQAGSWPLEIDISDEKGQHSGPKRMVFNVVPGDQSAPRIVTDLLPPAVAGSPYKAVFAAEGGLGRYQWDIRGNLPPGLRQTENGIAGTPEAKAVGQWPLQVSVRDEAGRVSALQNIVLTIDENWPDLSIETSTLPRATVLTRYVAPLIVRGCWGRCTWTAHGLPSGMTLTDGVLDGAPERLGRYQLQITVTDEKQRRATRSVMLEVDARS